VLESCGDRVRVCGPNDHRSAAEVGLVERLQVSDLLEDERLDVAFADSDVVIVERLDLVSLDGDLRYADTRRAQPACTH
jgi:hypothetical protein